MIGMCRSLGIPARYVSGYLYNGPGAHLCGAQASHAWCEGFVPGKGWFGLDPTNNTSPTNATSKSPPAATTPTPPPHRPIRRPHGRHRRHANRGRGQRGVKRIRAFLPSEGGQEWPRYKHPRQIRSQQQASPVTIRHFLILVSSFATMLSFLLRRAFSSIVVMFCVGEPWPSCSSARSKAGRLRRKDARSHHRGHGGEVSARWLAVAAIHGVFEPPRAPRPRSSAKYRDWQVAEILAQKLPNSISIGSIAFLLASTLGVLLGGIAAMNKDRAADRVAMFARCWPFRCPVSSRALL